MELVYLWVEDYKNIHEQGFNFSPRFRCEYDKDSNELSICDREDENCKEREECKEFCNEPYLKDFFGKTINVTAIVGKNGSGKSSLLEYLYEDVLAKGIFVYCIADNYYCYYSTNLKPDLEFSKKIKFNDDCINSKIEFLPTIKWFAKQEKIGKDRGLKYVNFDGGRPMISNSNMKNDYLLEEAQFFIPKYIYVYRKNQEILKSFKMSHIPYFETLRITLLNRNIQDLGTIQVKNKIIEQIILCTRDIDEYFIKIGQTISEYMKFRNFSEQFGKSLLIGFVELYLKESKNDIFNTTLLKHLKFFYDKINEKDKVIIHSNDILSIIQNIEKELSEKSLSMESLDLSKMVEAIQYIDTLNINFLDEQFSNIYFIDLSIDKLIADDMLYVMDIFHQIHEQNDLMSKEENSLRIFEYDLIDNQTKASYRTISDGEKQLLRFSIELYDEFVYSSVFNKSIVLLVDEIDNSLHPLWKKEVLSVVINIYQAFIKSEAEIKIHVVLTTHSPFLLSDIPKQNIIFLDKDEQGNCKVVDGLNDKEETFGANIHTLLSDSFFMKDGLIGEFAKNKINEIINFHNIVKKEKHKKCLKKIYEKREKRFRQTQSIIGEAYLKQILENHLLEIDKLLLGKDKAKEKLKERLEKQLRELDE